VTAISKPTILVIDDEPNIREVLGEFLAELGYVSVLAATGVAGLTALKKKPADAVLLDIAMPGAPGRARDAARDPRIVAGAAGHYGHGERG